MNVTLVLCLLVLYLLLMNELQSMDFTKVYFESFLGWTSPVHLASAIIIAVDVLYIFIYIVFRNAIYRKPGDNLLLVYFEVVSFACRFYYEGDLLNIVWLIPVIIFITRSSLTLFTSKQPNPLIQKILSRIRISLLLFPNTVNPITKILSN